MDSSTTANKEPPELNMWNVSTTSPPPPTNTTSTSFTLYVAAIHLWYVLPPLILLLGTFGNVTAIVIMRRMTSEESTVDVYLLGTAVTDLVFLYSLTLGQWLKYAFGFRVGAVHGVVCKVYTWLYTASGTISCWFLVCLTLHRALSVVWPHRVGLICTRRTVRRLVFGVGVILAGVYSHALVGMDKVSVSASVGSSAKCLPKSEDYISFLGIFVYVELCLYCLFPFACLLSANIVLVYNLAASVRNARQNLTQTMSQHVRTREKGANSVTLTVIVVSLTFLVLTLPTSVNFLQTFFVLVFRRASGYEQAELFFTATVRALLGHCNAAINFYLYCLTGSRFREEFCRLFSCRKSRGGSGERSSSSSSSVEDSHGKNHTKKCGF